MPKARNLFDILESIQSVDTVSDDLLVELLMSVKVELHRGRRKRPQAKVQFKKDELLEMLKSLQRQIDHGRAQLAFINRVARFDDEPSIYPNDEQDRKTEIHFPVESRHFGKEVFLLLGWAASDRCLSSEFADLRNRAQKNGWSRNRKRIRLQFDLTQDWLERLSQSDQSGFYPYDFKPAESIDWSLARQKIGSAFAADLQLIDGLVSGVWPNKELHVAYAGKTKAEIYFQWSVLVLKKMLLTTRDQKKISGVPTLEDLFASLDVDLDRDSLRTGKSRRKISGYIPREAPTYLWKSLRRLQALFP